MIPADVQNMLSTKGFLKRHDRNGMISKTLSAMGASHESDIVEFYCNWCPVGFISDIANEQLNDVIVLYEDTEMNEGQSNDPWDTPLGMATSFVRDVWNVSDNFVCLTTTVSEGAYLYENTSGKVFDFNLGQDDALREGRLVARWNSFYDFLRWYLS